MLLAAAECWQLELSLVGRRDTLPDIEGATLDEGCVCDAVTRLLLLDKDEDS